MCDVECGMRTTTKMPIFHIRKLLTWSFSASFDYTDIFAGNPKLYSNFGGRIQNCIHILAGKFKTVFTFWRENLKQYSHFGGKIQNCQPSPVERNVASSPLRWKELAIAGEHVRWTGHLWWPAAATAALKRQHLTATSLGQGDITSNNRFNSNNIVKATCNINKSIVKMTLYQQQHCEEDINTKIIGSRRYYLQQQHYEDDI